MAFDEKDFDRYYLKRFNICKKKYDKAFHWASENWYNMLSEAQGKNAISIANQIAEACKVSYAVGADIANSISISMAIN